MPEISQEYQPLVERHTKIVKVSLVGIVANLVLAGFKAMIGIMTNSIAITLDAVNNLSDVLSSVITIIGTKIAGKKPDKKHPLGHGRAEYLSSTIIAAIVLYAGITSMVESVKKIIHPEAASYTAVSLIIVAVAVVVKILLGKYFKAQGKKLNSDSLTNSGEDAVLDSVISASTLVAAILFLLTGLRLEAWLGVIISVVIIRSGIEMLKDALDDIVGHRPDGELTKGIKAAIESHDQVHGAYDLLVSNYGPNQQLASVHIEVDDTMPASEIDVLTREIQQEILTKFGVIISCVGVYSKNTGNDEAAEIRNRVTKIVMGHESVLQMHGFYMDLEKKIIRFDVIIDFEEENRDALFGQILQEVREEVPGYQVSAVLDYDLSD